MHLSKEEIHRLAKKGERKRKERLKREADRRWEKAHAQASPYVGGITRLIYTPMGNKR